MLGYKNEAMTESFSKNCYRGEYFGETCLLENGKRMGTVEAMTDCTLLSISKYDFKWIFEYQQ